MCIAIYKPAEALLPSLETLYNCWDNNPDGFGYAIRKDGKCEIRKGFMKRTDVANEYQYLKQYENCDILMHFRIATHGGVNPQNTHPFPITNDAKQLGKKSAIVNKCLIHNGVLPIEPRKKSISDTAEFALRIGEAGLTNIETVELFDGFIGTNKIALMNGVGVVTLGQWIKSNGVYYSNSTYSYAAYSHITYGSGGKVKSGYIGYGGYGCAAYGSKSSKKDDKEYFGSSGFRDYVEAYEPYYEYLTDKEKEELYEEYRKGWFQNDEYEYEYSPEEKRYVRKAEAKK